MYVFIPQTIELLHIILHLPVVTWLTFHDGKPIVDWIILISLIWICWIILGNLSSVILKLLAFLELRFIISREYRDEKKKINLNANTKESSSVKIESAYFSPYEVSTKHDDQGDYINIDFDKLEPGKEYFVIYDKGQYLISKTSDGRLSFSEVLRKVGT